MGIARCTAVMPIGMAILDAFISFKNLMSDGFERFMDLQTEFEIQYPTCFHTLRVSLLRLQRPATTESWRFTRPTGAPGGSVLNGWTSFFHIEAECQCHLQDHFDCISP